MTKIETTTPKGAILDPSTHTDVSAETVSTPAANSVVASTPAVPPAASGNNGTSTELTPRERSNQNLRMFKPGQSGNLSGRPKGIFTKSALRQLRKRNENGERNVDSIVLTQIDMAKAQGKLSTRAAEFLRDTTDGPPVREREGISVGTVNVLFAGALPEWMQPPAVANEVAARPSEPHIINTSELPWMKPDSGTLTERVGNQRNAKPDKS